MTVFFIILGLCAGALLWHRQGMEAVTQALFSGGELIALVVPLVIIALIGTSVAASLLFPEPKDKSDTAA